MTTATNMETQVQCAMDQLHKTISLIRNAADYAQETAATGQLALTAECFSQIEDLGKLDQKAVALTAAADWLNSRPH